MTRSMLGRTATCEMRMRWRSEVIICTSWRRRSTRACSLCSSASASGDEALTLGVLVQHTGERRQHLRVQRVGLGQRAHRAGEVACRARVDYRHGQARGLQRARSLELVAASGLQHGQRRAQPNSRLTRHSARPRRWPPAMSWARCCWPPPASGWKHRYLRKQSRHVPSLPSSVYANCKFLQPFGLQERTVQLEHPVLSHGLQQLAQGRSGYRAGPSLKIQGGRSHRHRRWVNDNPIGCSLTHR